MEQARGTSQLPAFSIIYGLENTERIHLSNGEDVFKETRPPLFSYSASTEMKYKKVLQLLT
jgi:hypothetical protein